ncbi:hypothetical protein PCASD_24011 [Puccinia coronata f. sp. avenae]|uniref:Uncharacterized protein n=1 Tax=Puccinia coronata f. sp. avenae TaxID=200324 RepID=A0A2N5S131_9BASI|nr:hypothetical protein PCASD_24011 [Puccinia coronata f. sp. avenae]
MSVGPWEVKSLPDGRLRFARGLAPLPPAGEGLVLSLPKTLASPSPGPPPTPQSP